MYAQFLPERWFSLQSKPYGLYTQKEKDGKIRPMKESVESANMGYKDASCQRRIKQRSTFPQLHLGFHQFYLPSKAGRRDHKNEVLHLRKKK
jgi:hypothetical protein